MYGKEGSGDGDFNRPITGRSVGRARNGDSCSKASASRSMTAFVDVLLGVFTLWTSFLDTEFFSSQVIMIPKYVVPFVRVTPLAPSGLC